MCEYFVKMVEDHPLITYIEDPLASEDFDAMRKLRSMLNEKSPSVQLGLKTSIAQASTAETLERIKKVT